MGTVHKGDRRVRWAMPVLAAVLLLASWLVGARPLRADRFELENGGTVEGRWLNRDQPSAAVVQVELWAGGRLSLRREQIVRRIAESERVPEYRERAARTADGAGPLWELAEWCREHDLTAQRERHLRRILELDSEHVRARHALGYSQVEGQWRTPSEHLRGQGYVAHDGRWRLPQEIELNEADRRRREAERSWLVRIKRWRERLDEPSDAEEFAEAGRQLAAIRDPRAVATLASYLARDPVRDAKLLYIEALGAIADPRAAQALVEATLRDPDEEVFHACLDQLKGQVRPQLVKRYVEGLRSPRNAVVNRAAQALGVVGDRQAVPALIEALVTQHAELIRGPGHGSPDAVTTTFARTAGDAPAPGFAGAGLNAGNQDRVIRYQVANRDVLGALIKLTGGPSFGYDRRAWKFWYDQQERSSRQVGPLR